MATARKRYAVVWSDRVPPVIRIAQDVPGSEGVTFAQAKAEIVAYYRLLIEQARVEIATVRDLRVSEVEPLTWDGVER